MGLDKKGRANLSESPIVRKKLSEQVFERLRNLIVTGELSPGDYVPSERVLMERFGVGRPAIREALQSMQSKGLITISHGERSRVNELNASIAFQQVDDIAKLLLSSEPSNLENLKQLRHIFEVGLIKIAAANSQPEDIEELRDLIEQQRNNLGDADAFIQVDILFHNKIAALTKNPLIVTVSEAMLKWLFEYHTVLLLWSGREDVTLLEHQKIVDCIEAHDSEKAAIEMDKHLSRSGSFYSHK